MLQHKVHWGHVRASQVDLRTLTLRTALAQPFFPPLIAMAIVLGVFTESTAALPALWRPLIVAGLAALLLQVASSVTLGSRHRAALVSTALLLAVAGYLLVALVLATSLLAITGWLIGSGRPIQSINWARATEVANVTAAVTVTLAVVTVAGATSFGDPPRSAAPTLETDGARPDIYLIMVDGHPRLDTLASEFDYDPRPFVAAMEAQGFEFSAQSTSNYNLTVLSVTSLLNFQAATELMPNPPASPIAQYRQLAQHLNASVGLRALRGAGYEVVSIPSPFSNVTLYEADRVLATGDVTDFELDLLAQGGVRRLLPGVQRSMIADSHRSRIRSALDSLGRLAEERGSSPKVVLAHIMAPHPPYVFGPAGEPTEPLDCFPESCGFWTQESYPSSDLINVARDQVAFIDASVAEATEAIIGASPTPPVIIVLSDHGHRHNAGDVRESVRTLFLAHTPGAPGTFPPDVTTTQVLPHLFNAYFGTELSVPEVGSFFVDINRLRQTGPMDMTPISFAEEGED